MSSFGLTGPCLFAQTGPRVFTETGPPVFAKRGSLTLTMPRNLVRLNRLMLAVAASTHVPTAVLATCLGLPKEHGGFVLAASHPTIASDACAGRVWLAEQPVYYSLKAQQLHEQSRVAPAAVRRTDEFYSPQANAISAGLTLLASSLGTSWSSRLSRSISRQPRSNAVCTSLAYPRAR
jgi:hypothetical protein